MRDVLSKIDERLFQAAIQFCFHDAIILELRRAAKRCTEMRRFDYETGEPACGSCDLDDPDEESRCGPCQARVIARPKYKLALQERYAAKRKMARLSIQRLAAMTATGERKS